MTGRFSGSPFGAPKGLQPKLYLPFRLLERHPEHEIVRCPAARETLGTSLWSMANFSRRTYQLRTIRKPSARREKCVYSNNPPQPTTPDTSMTPNYPRHGPDSERFESLCLSSRAGGLFSSGRGLRRSTAVCGVVNFRLGSASSAASPSLIAA